MTTRISTLLAAGLLVLSSTAALSGPVGQKLDSGLGELPHYSKWLDKSGKDPMGSRVLGESLDDGLGELPPYSKWLDKSGKDPMGRHTQREIVASR